MDNRKTLLFIITLIAIIILSVIYFRGTEIKQLIGLVDTCNPDRADLAVVIECAGISKEEFNKAYDRQIVFYVWSDQQDIDPEILKQDIVENLIFRYILYDYAKKNDIVISKQRVDDLLLQKVANHEPKDLLDDIYDMYGMNESEYKNELEYDILKEEIQIRISGRLVDWEREQRMFYRIEVLI